MLQDISYLWVRMAHSRSDPLLIMDELREGEGARAASVNVVESEAAVNSRKSVAG